MAREELWTFYLSYAPGDHEWAEWIAWQLDREGYSVLFQGWDQVPGTHWTAGIHGGLIHAEHVLAVVSADYLQSVLAAAEWQTAWRDDPAGLRRRLLPVRIEDCEPIGLLAAVSSFDLFGREAQAARRQLLAKVAAARVGTARPLAAPPFPDDRSHPGSVPHPASLPQPPRTVQASEPPRFPRPDHRRGRVREAVFETDGLPGGAILLSYAQDDALLAAGIAEHLHQLGYGHVFAFDHTDTGGAAVAWQDALAASARSSDLVLQVVSRPTASWIGYELALCHRRGIPVITALTVAGARHPGLDSGNVIDLSRVSADQPEPGDFEALAAAVRRTGLLPGPRGDLHLHRQVYPGLRAFDTDEAGAFHGRSREIARLTEVVDGQEKSGSLVVIGPSGVGKSSLVHAGLVPRLRTSDRRWLVLPAIRPEHDPFHRLARALAGPAIPSADVAALAGRLRTDDDALLAAVTERLARLPGTASRALLILDQAEELFTLSLSDGERRAFLHTLTRATAGGTALWTVFTIRAEFLTELLRDTPLPTFAWHSLVLGPMRGASLRRAIVEPARGEGWEFAPEVISEMVSEADGGDGLPLLAYTLHDLWARVTGDTSRRAGPDRVVTLDDYEAAGGITGTLEQRADAALVNGCRRTGLAPADIVGVIARLAAVNDEGIATRQAHRLHELGEVERAALLPFVDAGLLRTRSGGGAGTAPAAPAGPAAPAADLDELVRESVLIEISHEALLRAWPPLARLLVRWKEALHARGVVERLAREWDAAGRSPGYLLTRDRLTDLRRALTADSTFGAVPLRGLGRELLDASLARAADDVADRALGLLATSPHLAVALCAAAVEDFTPTAHAVDVFRRCLAASRVHRALAGHSLGVWGVAWSPDEQRCVTAGKDGTARTWWVATALPDVSVGHGVWIRSVDWSPTGRTLLTSATDLTVRTWTDGVWEPTIHPHPDRLWAARWSRTGDRFVTAGADGVARIWRPGQRTPEREFSAPTTRIWDAELSPDGASVVTAGEDGAVRVIDAVSGASVVAFDRHVGNVRTARWSPDGRRIASGGKDNTIWIFGVVSDAPAAQALTGHTNQVRRLDWSPDGHRLASASADNTVRVWDVHTGTELLCLRGHDEGPCDVAWSPSGHRLLSGAEDNRVLVWTVGPPQLTVRRVVGQVTAVACSPDGRRVAWGTDGGDVVTADIGDPVGRVRRIHHHDDGPVRGLDWSADGRLVSAGGQEAAILEPEGDGPVVLFTGHRDAVWSARWSPDGQRVVTAAEDRTARVWSSTGELLAVHEGHTSWVRAAVWSTDGAGIAMVSEDHRLSVRPWSGPSDGPRQIVDAGAGLWSVDCAADGTTIAAGQADGAIQLWDAASLSPRRVLAGHQGTVHAVRFSRSGERLLSVAADGVGRLWNTRTGATVATLVGHSGPALDCVFAPDEDSCITVGQDGTIRTWDLRQAEERPLCPPTGDDPETGDDAETAARRLCDEAGLARLGELSDDERRAHGLPVVN
ncbi:hypothetical protein CC117_17850 [Parafrankia colletiae]|uniref:TIR domain-containing protein n=1 Tax=Parafrankia colletiae TaxID=573497 RepID=A0A1S1QP68_9ACTN|nr:TIR domain-containing protein [Parafrankia colletiae]MCK9901885.1 TIR domain-containing protein [Frankia sp. Cpl3]OHV36538.1 hypothetical protein CC117_17850 [Parafrankia colletiae]